MMSKPKKILITRLGAIGDVVHTTVIQQAIKQKYPDCEIHFLTSAFIAPLLENDQNLTKVYAFNNQKKDDFFYLLWMGFLLRREKFDVIINLQNAFRNMFLHFIAAPKQIVRRNPNRVHAVDAFFNTAKDVFDDIEQPEDLKLTISDEVKNSISEKIKDYPRPFVVINPGGENDNFRQGRIWSLTHWVSLSNKLTQKYGGTIFVVGSSNEKDYHKGLIGIASLVTYTGELKLQESAALFGNADLFISGDSGPLHMASALDVNTVGLMGSTSKISSGPYGSKGYSIEPYYDCISCGQKVCARKQDEMYTPCMEALSPQQVFDFIVENNLLG